ncbi:unnamed protein product, partial [Porites lobata]
MSRMNRVLPKPALQEPRVMVSVRHPTLGVLRRAFPPNYTVMALYDWVGSLFTRPQHFALCFSSPYRIVCPEDDIKEVSRHNCVNNMLTLFRQQSVADSKLCLLFKGEHAVGSGVLREVYSVFWDSFVSSYCEGSSHFTFSVTAAMSQDDFVAVGRILTHQFIKTGTLPLQIVEAIIQQAVTGRVSEECSVQSLLMLLHEKQREILQQALLGVKPFPTEDVIDILADYGITAIPCTSNMKQLILQVSETELISKPFMCITKLREGMGSFWDGVNAEEMHAVYSICTPTHSSI